MSKEECSSNECNKEAVEKCSFCGRNWCEYHLKPKHTASRRYIGSLTDPILIKIFSEEEVDDGHPCPKYHERWLEEYEKEKEKKLSMISIIDALDSLASNESEISTYSGTCQAPNCDNRSVVRCKTCKSYYCGYHASRKKRLLARLGGHVCERQSSTIFNQL